MRAIVTGGAGFIGSNLVDAIVARGDAVHVLDDLSKGRRENVSAGADLHIADIRDPDAVFDEVHPDVVFHLATHHQRSIVVIYGYRDERFGARFWGQGSGSFRAVQGP